jgi:hypothetical protein
MKKLLMVMMAMLAMVVLGGCAANSTTPNGWWVKQYAANEQVLKDMNECQVPAYLKENMLTYESDVKICVDAEMARRNRAYNLSSFSFVASQIVGTCSQGLADRCMATKGYVKNPKYPVRVDKCMEEKGYRWGNESEVK